MAFFVLGSGTRTGDWTLTLSNNGVPVFTTMETGSQQSYVHMGTNSIGLSAGLVFDQMNLTYALTDYTPEGASTSGSMASSTVSRTAMGSIRPLDDYVGTTIQGPLPIFGAPEQNPYYPEGVVYVPGVPEPGTYALFALGLAGLAAFGRRRARR